MIGRPGQPPESPTKVRDQGSRPPWSEQESRMFMLLIDAALIGVIIALLEQEVEAE